MSLEIQVANQPRNVGENRSGPYFLLRVPEVSCCKDCGAQERSDFQFCP